MPRALRNRGNFPTVWVHWRRKHIVMQLPKHSGSWFRNYKGTNSVMLLALVDAYLRFISVDVSTNGVSDGSVWNKNNFWTALQRENLQQPGPKPLPSRATPVPYVVVADEAFAPKTNTMKPYDRAHLNRDTILFNYRSVFHINLTV